MFGSGFLSGPLVRSEVACIIQGHGRRLDDNNATRRETGMKSEDKKNKINEDKFFPTIKKKIVFERESVDTKEAKGKLRSLAESLPLGGRERGCSLFLRYSRIANFGTTSRGASANARLYKWCVEGRST